MVSPSGFFRIHYDETESEVPNYDPSLSTEENVMLVAAELDFTYNFEINTLGYPPPPTDNGAGGDNKYDVYITSTGGNYGWTEWEDKVGSTNWTSFMVIHYSYAGFYSDGLDGAKVTVAHEFHHGIQMGNYGVLNGDAPIRDNDVYFYEITSTSMEEFVYDNVNDYYAYIPNYFQNPDRSFVQNNGYNLAHWNIFLKDNFGYEIIKLQLQLLPNQQAINAINSSIINYGSTFPYQLNKFGIWTYFTNYRTVPGQYFEEAVNYPLITPLATYPFSPPSKMVQIDAAATSNNFLVFNVSTNGDVLYTIVTNGDANSASPIQNPLFNFDYTLFSDSTSGQRKLTENYSSTFNASSSSVWSVSEILNDIVVRQDTSQNTIIKVEEVFVFPNPYHYSKSVSDKIFVAFDTDVGKTLSFNVYSSGMSPAYSSQAETKSVTKNGKTFTVIEWNALDNDGEKLATGVYVVVIKNGDDILKGKVVIFNE
jgi:hypothetical protein